MKFRKPLHFSRPRRLTALGLAFTLLAAFMIPGAGAAEVRTPAEQKSKTTQTGQAGGKVAADKQEIIYVNLNGDGSVQNIYVVNRFDLDEKGRIVDHGDYTALRNLTTNDEIHFEDQKVTIDTQASTLYYQGTLSSSTIPWDLSLSYWLDGAPILAEELAGKSGRLRIEVSIKENPDCDSSFFKHYVLQMALTLDAKRVKNIEAEGAAQAWAGSNLQLTYMLLPGRESENVITADVTDFRMDAITLAGVPMNMDFDIEGELEKNETFTDSLQELKDAGVTFDDGAADLLEASGKLRDGARDMKDGNMDLKDGLSELYDGAIELSEGQESLLDGMQTMDDSVWALADGVGEMADGAKDLSGGVSALKDGNQSLYDGLAQLYDGLDTYYLGVDEFYDGLGELHQGVQGLSGGLSAITAQNAALQTMSGALFGQALEQTGAFLGANGYEVTMDTGSRALADMMTRRQNEITGEEAQLAAQQAAVEARLTALQTIAMGGTVPGLEMNAEEAAGRLGYWQLVLAGQDPGELIVYAESETAVIEAAVTQALTEALSGDEVYMALAVLAYYKGVIDYTNGVSSITSGASELQSGTGSARNGAKELRDGAKALRDSTGEILDGLGDLIDGAVEMESGTIQLWDGMLTLHDGVLALGDGSTQLVDGMTELHDGTLSLCDGLLQIRDGMAELCDGSIRFYDGTVEFYDGIVELKDGTLEFRDGMEDMDTKFADSIKTSVQDLFGGDFTPVSFVSPLNDQTSFVQFVIRTPAIELPEETWEEAAEEEITFWGRFLNLFGIDSKS